MPTKCRESSYDGNALLPAWFPLNSDFRPNRDLLLFHNLGAEGQVLSGMYNEEKIGTFTVPLPPLF